MVASGGDSVGDHLGSPVPVKNTFVHFADPEVPSRGRALRRCQTDPEGEDIPAVPTSTQPMFIEERRIPLAETKGVANRQDAKGSGTPKLSFGKENALPCQPPALTQVLSVPSTPEPSPRCWAAAPLEGAGTPLQLQRGACGSSPDSPAWSASPPACTWRQPEWTPSRVPPFPAAVSVAAAVAPCGPQAAVAVGALPAPAPGIAAFCFALRRADDTELGIDVRCGSGGKFLVVQQVLQGGALESWNRQCMEGMAVGKAVFPGDTIVSINGLTDCHGMLNACRNDMLLRMVVARRDPQFESRRLPATEPWQDIECESRLLSVDLLESLHRPGIVRNSSAYVDLPVRIKCRKPIPARREK